MWISKAHYETMVAGLEDGRKTHAQLGEQMATIIAANAEAARLRSDLEWFKLRLNQVEMERAMLMQDRLGVKINVPQFVPTHDGGEQALQQMPNLSSVGHDAIDQGPVTDADPAEGVDFTAMPGYNGRRVGQ